MPSLYFHEYAHSNRLMLVQSNAIHTLKHSHTYHTISSYKYIFRKIALNWWVVYSSPFFGFKFESQRSSFSQQQRRPHLYIIWISKRLPHTAKKANIDWKYGPLLRLILMRLGMVCGLLKRCEKKYIDTNRS